MSAEAELSEVMVRAKEGAEKLRDVLEDLGLHGVIVISDGPDRKQITVTTDPPTVRNIKCSAARLMRAWVSWCQRFGLNREQPLVCELEDLRLERGLGDPVSIAS